MNKPILYVDVGDYMVIVITPNELPLRRYQFKAVRVER
jgi:hypothetical protein